MKNNYDKTANRRKIPYNKNLKERDMVTIHVLTPQEHAEYVKAAIAEFRERFEAGEKVKLKVI